MIDSYNKEPRTPSMLREANSRHDSVIERIRTIRGYSEKMGLYPPKELKNDEHYWFTVISRFNVVKNILTNSVPNEEQLKIVSLSISMNEAEEFLKLEKLRATDGLTRAWSRTALDNYAENLRASPHKGFATGVLLFDVDHFKEYNDTMGHPEGDKILIKLVETMKAKTRSTDMVGRYGGEEFMIMLTNLPEETSLKIINEKAENLRNEVEKNLGVTVSIGTTTINGSDQNITDIYKRADRYLYKAKESGRNQICSDNGLLARKS